MGEPHADQVIVRYKNHPDKPNVTESFEGVESVTDKGFHIRIEHDEGTSVVRRKHYRYDVGEDVELFIRV